MVEDLRLVFAGFALGLLVACAIAAAGGLHDEMTRQPPSGLRPLPVVVCMSACGPLDEGP